MSSVWAEIAGRRVKICAGRKSQSVNICFEDSPRDGAYEFRYKTWATARLSAYDLVLQGFAHVGELCQFLVSSDYEDISDQASRGRTWDPLPPDQQWGDNQREKIDGAVERLIDHFLENPYRHRVEHSLHCDLFRLLEEVDAIRDGRIAIGGGSETRLVHKEWPETFVRAQKTGRGNFDLAVLTPFSGGQTVEVERFLGGHIQPYAAFELGLDYDRDHFLNDVTKLRHSRIEAGYVIHFARAHAADQDQVQECLGDLVSQGKDGKDGWPNLVVVILNDRGEPVVKRLN